MFSLCLDPLLFAALFARQIMAAEEIVHTIYKTLYFNLMPVFFLICVVILWAMSRMVSFKIASKCTVIAPNATVIN